MTVRTRFAPSPTGCLHIGSVRTALFSWLYARHCKGTAILRIEDTDKERSTQASVNAILSGLDWLGLEYQEGPIYQTARYDRYQQIAEQLLSQDKAYWCVCSKERLENLRTQQLANKEKPRYDGYCRNKQLSFQSPSVLRFKNPLNGTVSFEDKVYGFIEINNQELDDLVLIRSDNHPTYNFAVVIDDWDMNITHVIRGDDHLSNTPRQINLFQALNAQIPIFAHLPMILGEDGKRLSKRHGAVDVLDFKKQGILPKALLNYLVRLGWSHGDEEIFSLNQMIKAFDLTHISRGVATFNYDKLHWLNQHYLKTETLEDLLTPLKEQLLDKGVNLAQGPELKELLLAQKERYKTLAEMSLHSVCYYKDEIDYNSEAVKKYWQIPLIKPLKDLCQQLAHLTLWQAELIEHCVKAVCTEYQLNLAKLAPAIRVAITGDNMSPSIDQTLVLVGQKKSLDRLQYCLAYLTKL